MQGRKVALLAGLIALVYWPTLRGGFIWDDDTFLTANPLIKAADGLRRFWLTRQPTDYWPVTSSSLWVEWRLWGMHAAGYHATNVALHFIAVLLLWSVLERLRIPGAFLAAALFAVHPVNVESVAWITQRKNLLAMVFYLGSIRCFLESGWKAYALSLGAFVLAMLSKGSVAMLPVVLFGIVVYHRRFELRVILRLVPFLAVSAGLTAVNLLFSQHGDDGAGRSAGWLERLLGAPAAVLFYLWKAILPVRLMFVYPQWKIEAENLLWWLPLAGCLVITWILWRLARRGVAGPEWAWGYFCVSLVPVMGFADVYFMRYSLVSDHYQHLALIGVVVLAGYWLGRAPMAVSAGVVAVLAAFACAQAQTYSNLETLYRTTIARNPGCWMAENNLGEILVKDPARRQEAVGCFEKAARLNPRSREPRDNLGDALTRTGRVDQAIAELREALRLDPGDPAAHNNLGNAYFKAGQLRAALGEYGEAVKLNPRLAAAHYNLGKALSSAGMTGDAVAEMQTALRLSPDNAQAHDSLGNLYFHAGRVKEAIDEFGAAVRLDPDFAEARDNLGVVLWKAGRVAEAENEWRAVLHAHPDDIVAQKALGRVHGLDKY